MALLLYVIDEGVYFIQPKQKRRRYVPFSETEKLDAAFETIAPFTEVNVVFDLYEEDVSFSDAPKAYPWERQQMLALQLKRHQGVGVLLVGGDWLTRRGGKDQIRVRRLVAESHVQMVFERLEKHRLVVLGIYSATFLLERVLPALQLPRSLKKRLGAEPVLVTIRRDATSYRQLFFHEGRIKFTRTLQLPELVEGDREILAYLARECDMTIKYLYSNRRAIPMQTPISLLLIESPKFSVTVHEIRTFLMENLVEARRWPAEQWELAVLLADSVCRSRSFVEFMVDVLLCVFSRRRLPASQFTHPHQQVAARMRMGRMAAVAATVMLLAAGGWLLGQHGGELWFLKEKTTFMADKIRQTQQLKADLQARLDTPYDARDLRAIVTFSEQFRTHMDTASVEHFLRAFAEALQANPDIGIRALQISRGGNLFARGFDVEAELVLQKPAVLYQQVLQRLYRWEAFMQQQPGISDFRLTKLPINTALEQQQQVDASLLLPEQTPFSVRFRWRGGQT